MSYSIFGTQAFGDIQAEMYARAKDEAVANGVEPYMFDALDAMASGVASFGSNANMDGALKAAKTTLSNAAITYAQNTTAATLAPYAGVAVSVAQHVLDGKSVDLSAIGQVGGAAAGLAVCGGNPICGVAGSVAGKVVGTVVNDVIGSLFGSSDDDAKAKKQIALWSALQDLFQRATDYEYKVVADAQFAVACTYVNGMFGAGTWSPGALGEAFGTQEIDAIEVVQQKAAELRVEQAAKVVAYRAMAKSRAANAKAELDKILATVASGLRPRDWPPDLNKIRQDALAPYPQHLPELYAKDPAHAGRRPEDDVIPLAKRKFIDQVSYVMNRLYDWDPQTQHGRWDKDRAESGWDQDVAPFMLNGMMMTETHFGEDPVNRTWACPWPSGTFGNTSPMWCVGQAVNRLGFPIGETGWCKADEELLAWQCHLTNHTARFPETVRWSAYEWARCATRSAGAITYARVKKQQHAAAAVKAAAELKRKQQAAAAAALKTVKTAAAKTLAQWQALQLAQAKQRAAQAQALSMQTIARQKAMKAAPVPMSTGAKGAVAVGSAGIAAAIILLFL